MEAITNINTFVSDCTVPLSTTNQEKIDTISVIDFVCKLKFEIDENRKSQFFDDLENVLENTNSIEEGFVSFLFKHISSNGKITV